MRRPAPSTTMRRWAAAARGMAAAATAAPTNRRRVNMSGLLSRHRVPRHRGERARLERDPLDVPGDLSVGGPEMHVQIGIAWSEDATMTARAEAEHIDDAALELEASLGALVERRRVRQVVALVQHVKCDGGRVGVKPKDEWRGLVDAALAGQTLDRRHQRCLVVDRPHLHDFEPRVDLVIHQETRRVFGVGVRLDVDTSVDDARDTGLTVEDRDLTGHPGTRTKRIEVRQGGQLMQRDLAADVAAQHVALGADPPNGHRVAADGGRKPKRPSTVCPSRLVKRCRYAWAMAACLAPATTAAG